VRCWCGAGTDGLTTTSLLLLLSLSMMQAKDSDVTWFWQWNSAEHENHVFFWSNEEEASTAIRQTGASFFFTKTTLYIKQPKYKTTL
jgi:hypothetical protein